MIVREVIHLFLDDPEEDYKILPRVAKEWLDKGYIVCLSVAKLGMEEKSK